MQCSSFASLPYIFGYRVIDGVAVQWTYIIDLPISDLILNDLRSVRLQSMDRSKIVIFEECKNDLLVFRTRRLINNIIYIFFPLSRTGKHHCY